MSDHFNLDGTESPSAELSPPVSAGPRADIADGVERRLDPGVVWVWRFGHAVAAGFLCLVALGAVGFLVLGAGLPAWTWPLLLAGWMAFAAAAACWAFFWPALRYRYEAYRIYPDALEIRRGVLWRTVVHVPASRVQHTDVSRGPIERALGLATVVIYTAGTEHASIGLGGLPEATAFAVRDHLIPGDGDDAV